MNKLITVLLFYVYVFSVSALNTFIENGQRPELFELTDNEIVTFKITIPDEEFTLLKEKANVQGLTPPISNFTLEMELGKQSYRVYFEEMLNQNFTKLFPNIDVNAEFPGFFIGSDGYANIDKIMENLDFDPKNYKNFDFVWGNLGYQILALGKYDYVQLLVKYLGMLENLNTVDKETLESTETLATKIIESTKVKQDTEIKSIANNILETTTSEQSSNINSTTTLVNDENIQQENDNENQGDMSQLIKSNDFKTKNGKLTVDIAGIQKSFDEITFSLSGQYSRSLVKPNFNIKIRGKKDLFGSSQLKLRSDLTEPTFLRSKLTSDIHKKLGIAGISANYATLYINGEYMGLFVLTDAYKLSWIKQVYGEKDTKFLYKCNGVAYLDVGSVDKCTNENDEDDVTESNLEWADFLVAMTNAQSAEDIEDIFEVDHFIKEMAIEYLLGSWDHIQLGHNYYLYKQPNGKWIYLTYDHDHTFGINLDRIFIGYFFVDLPERNVMKDYPNFSFSDWTQKHQIIQKLILNDPARFNQALKEIVSEVFNPAILFPRIDELKEFIRSYAEKDYTADEEGKYPGRINALGINPYTFEHWEANSEFTSVTTLQYNAYGIKYWILSKYRNVCKTYDLECDPLYLDENYEFSIDENVQFTGYDFSSYQAPVEYNPTTATTTLIETEPTPSITITESSSIENELPTSESDNEIEIDDDVEIETENDSSESETESIY